MPLNKETKPNDKGHSVWFGLAWFYGISIIVGYLMPSPVYSYILDVYDL